MAKILRYEEIMKAALTNMVARQDKITDFNEGSVIHTILDTVSRIAERLYVAIRQGYNEMLKTIPYSPFKFTKKQGVYATGRVIFSRAIAGGVVALPKGLMVSGGGLSYRTTVAGAIEEGKLDSSPITCIAMETGAAGNIASGVINSIDSTVDEAIVAVSNKEPFTGGADTESDSDFEGRFKDYLAGLSGTNTYAIKEAALSLPSVRSCSIQNHKPPLENIYNATIYVDDGTGGAGDDVLQAVRLVVEGDGTKANSGHLAPGINVRIIPPSIIPIDIDVTITIGVVQEDTARAELTSLVIDYINSLSVGQSFLIAELNARLMGVSYVKDVVIRAPSSNITIGAGSIARAGTMDIKLVGADSV